MSLTISTFLYLNEKVMHLFGILNPDFIRIFLREKRANNTMIFHI